MQNCGKRAAILKSFSLGMHTTKQQSQLHQKPPQTLYQNNSNPVKRGYVDFSEHWRYSSYRNYFDTGLEVVFDGVEIVVW
jgi:hypothetical protein